MDDVTVIITSMSHTTTKASYNTRLQEKVKFAMKFFPSRLKMKLQQNFFFLNLDFHSKLQKQKSNFYIKILFPNFEF